MLYKSDGGRLRPRYLMSQSRSTSSVTDSAKKSDVSPVSASSKSQATAKQVQTDCSSKTKRTSHLPNAEEARPNATSRQSRNDVRLSLLPRLAAQNQTSNSSQTANRTTQLTVKFEKQMPDEDQPRNMLRRKAPTIGQPKKPNGQGPEKLRVVIPNTSRPGQFINATPRLPAQGEMTKNSPSLPAQQSQPVNKDAEPAIQGPKELASLRTTINTQNLLPPTFALHSASSLSTKCSESPGIWSRGSTPTTTISSCSPGVFYSPKIGHSRHFSPSETRLPVYSPLTQISSPLSESDQKSIRSPSLDKATASLASLVNSEQEEAPKNTSTYSPKSHLSPKSALPRRTSVYSSLPTRTKVDTHSAQKDQQEPEKSVAETLGSPTAPSKLKNAGSAPSRPTREGTDQLESEPSPVIRSDLPPKIMSSHKRRDSVEKNSTSKSTAHSATTSTDSLNTRRQSRIPSQPTSQVMPQKLPRTSSKEGSEKPDTKSPTTPSSATSRRFGLFPKRSKTETDAQASAQYRLPRKGPVARIGHESYGKYAQRDRRMSSSSNTSATRTRSMSTTENTPKPTSNRKESLKNRPELDIDDFLRNRLEPVVISGGGGMDGRPSLMRTQSEQSAMSGCSTISPTNTTQTVKGAYSTGCSTDSLATLSATAGDPSMKPRTNSEGGGQSRAPISRIGGAFHRAAASQPTVSRSSSQIRPDKAPIPPKDQDQKGRKKSFRSFFQRSHSKPRKNSTTEVPSSSSNQLPAQVTPVPVNRPVAHYALLDTDPDSLEDVMHDIEDSPPTDYDYSESSPPAEAPAALNIRKSTLLPSPPRLQTEFHAGWQSPPKVYMNKGLASCSPGTEEKPVVRRPSRLASIGRIPQVISRKDRQHRPAAQSFSRPFSMAETPSLTAPVLSNDFQVPTCSEEMGRRPSEPTRLGFDLTQPFGDPTYRSVLDLISGPYSNNEFLRFSPDKNSLPSSFECSTPAVTAIAPHPDSDLTDDEVWKEYDDLIDDVLSPISPKTTLPDFATSDDDEKLGLAALASQTLQNELNAPHLPTLFEQPSITLNRASQSSDGCSVRLRRSRIATALRSSYAPSSQPSYSDLKAGQEEETGESEKGGPSSPSLKLVEEQQSFPLSPLNPSQSFEACRQRNTILFDIAERDREGPTAQTNIRSGSLMTSRWLSFGRVLFSPAHNHVKSGEQERILVIDGLGNDDWSFYCALTYTNADVYNLHVGLTPAASSHPAAWQPPTNHHTVYHADLADRFPFPKGHFAATVLRFPAACSESVQDNVVSECKRVLRPGGYLEMSIMDLDMVNMGIRTRKAVRGLKERTYVADPSISLKPASDSIQRLLGRHAFDNLHRCMVRIPVAGVITRSSASSSSTSSSSLHPSMSIPAATRSAPSFGQGSNNPFIPRHNKHGKSQSNDTDLSLGDLLSDPVPSPSNDESIRKIVAKVGRWWYTRCYEIPVLPDGDVDCRIWNDGKVLRECQKRGTGFRLLIAHAQKPSEVNRRTASV